MFYQGKAGGDSSGCVSVSDIPAPFDIASDKNRPDEIGDLGKQF